MMNRENKIYPGKTDICPTEEDYLEAKHVPFLGNVDTSIAKYVWLPLKLDGEYPVIEWKDEWKID